MIRSISNIPGPVQFLLGLQHVFAIILGTMIVPVLTGFPLPITLLMAGGCTLVFQYFTSNKVPLFFSCSFFFIGAYSFIQQTCIARGMSPEMGLCYGSFGIFISGIIIGILGLSLALVNKKMIAKLLLPTIITSPFIMALGISMIGVAVNDCVRDPLLAAIALVTSLLAIRFCKGYLRMIPIVVGVILTYAIAIAQGKVDFTPVHEASWVGLPFTNDYCALTVMEDMDYGMLFIAIVTMIPLIFEDLVEHIGDVVAVSKTTGINYPKAIGLNRTIGALGMCTCLAGFIGSPAPSAFSQTTGLIKVTRMGAPGAISIAALGMIVLAFCPKLTALMGTIPAGIIGGVTLIMYVMIAVVGVNTLLSEKVDMRNAKNLTICIAMVVSSTIVTYLFDDRLTLFGIPFSGLALAGMIGYAIYWFIPNKHTRNE